MEPLGATASIVGLAAATLKVIKYVNSVKDSSSERRSLKEESEGLLQLLGSLESTLKDPGQSAKCFDSIKTLVAPKGPIDQLREALDQLNKKVEPKKSVKDYARALTWTLDKDHCNEVLGKIERVKSSIGLALQGETRYVWYRHRGYAVIGSLKTVSVFELYRRVSLAYTSKRTVK